MKKSAFIFQICIVALTAMISFSGCALMANYPPGQGTDTNIANLWITEDSLFYLTQNGEPYQKEKQNDRLLYKFPTHALFYLEETGELLYYCDDAIRAYDLSSGTDTKKVDLEGNFSGECFLLGAGDTFFYLQDEERMHWKVFFDSLKKEETPVAELLFSDKKWLIWGNVEGNSLVITDKTSGEEKILPLADGSEEEPCISICRMGDNLLYLRADGTLRHCPLPGTSENGESFSKIREALSGERVLAVASSGEDLVCVLGEPEGDVCLTTLVVVEANGSLHRLRASGEPSYSVPGSCILRTNEYQYAYAVTTAEQVIREVI